MSEPEPRTAAAGEVEQAGEHLQRVRVALSQTLTQVDGAIATIRSQLDEGGGSDGS